MARIFSDLERGPRLLDLWLDSIGLELGAAWLRPGAPVHQGSGVGFWLGAGMELPLFWSSGDAVLPAAPRAMDALVRVRRPCVGAGSGRFVSPLGQPRREAHGQSRTRTFRSLMRKRILSACSPQASFTSATTSERSPTGCGSKTSTTASSAWSISTRSPWITTPKPCQGSCSTWRSRTSPRAVDPERSTVFIRAPSPSTPSWPGTSRPSRSTASCRG
jgi:hypothetical protein